MDEARAIENNPSTEGVTGGESGYYVGSGRSASDAKNKGKNKGKSFLKKGGPIGLILAAVLGVGIAGFGGQSFQAFSLVNNIMSNYGSSSYSTTARLSNTIRKAIKGKSKVKVTPELEEAGDSAGIKFNSDADGNLKSITMDSTGDVFDAGNIDAGMDGRLGDNISKAGQNIDIQSTYNSQTKTKAASRIEWEKNRYGDYDNGKSGTDADVDMDFEETASGKKNTTKLQEVDPLEKEGEGEDSKTRQTQRDSKIEDGEVAESSRAKQIETDSSGNKNKIDVDVGGGSMSVKAKVQSIAEGANKIAGVASTAACIYAGIATAVAIFTIGQQVYSMINMASGYMEATQKVQAGDGDGSSFHEYQNRTNQTTDGKGFWTSTSIASIFGGDTGNSSAGVANLENIATSDSATGIFVSAGASIDGWKTCLALRVTAAITGMIVDAIGDIIGGATLGVGKFVQIAISAAISAVIALSMQAAVAALTDHISTLAAKTLGIDPITDMGSEEAGDYTVSGGNIILSAMGRSMGQSAGTSEKVAEFNAYKEEVIARLAEYDRDNLSPFDMSSQYTFLGSLKYSLAQFSVLNSSNSSILSFIKTTSVMVSNSVAKLMPTSSAYEYSSIINQDGDCPFINSAGGENSRALGTALHCNYVSISDSSSFDITYEEAVQYLQDHGQLTYDEVPKIVKNKELEKYVKYWTIRDAHLGLADSSITADIANFAQANTDNNTANTSINSIIGAVPYAGDFIDITNATIESANYEYIFGAKYVAGGEYWNGDDGGEMMRNIQAFLELDTMYSDLALIEESTLANYLEEYYTENPLDESYEGRLARFSGLSKDEVIAVLDYLDYVDYIANYDSTTCYKFFEEEPRQVISLDNKDNYVEAVNNITESLDANRATIIYADPRTLYTTSA